MERSSASKTSLAATAAGLDQRGPEPSHAQAGAASTYGDADKIRLAIQSSPLFSTAQPLSGLVVLRQSDRLLLALDRWNRQAPAWAKAVREMAETEPGCEVRQDHRLIGLAIPLSTLTESLRKFLSLLPADRTAAATLPFRHSYYGGSDCIQARRDGQPSCSIIINTRDRPDALERVLKSLSAQTRLPDEVVIADDGSDTPTQVVIQNWAAKQPFPVVCAWHRHEGFHRTRIMNRAMALITGEYCVLTDHDMVLHPRFISDHLRLAKPGRFVQGRRILTTNERAGREFGARSYTQDLWRGIWNGDLNRRFGALRWPLPLVYYSQDHIHAVRACNFGAWTKDLVRVGGYDERFVGWGRADSELVLRLFRAGVRRLNEKGWAMAVHLWHESIPREHLPENDALLKAAEKGLDDKARRGIELHRPILPYIESPEDKLHDRGKSQPD